MNKNPKKNPGKVFRGGVALLLALICAVLPTAATVCTAQTYKTLTHSGSAVVLQVTDGDALTVQMADSGQVSLVRLAGLGTHGNNDALFYTTNQLLGKTVELRLDNAWQNARTARWTPVYLYCDNVFFNRVLVQKGLAYVDAAYAQYHHYRTLLNDENIAKNRQLGLWAQDGHSQTAQPSYTGTRVNINTATITQIYDALEQISYTAARRIVEYRQYNDFYHVREVKFANALSRDEYTAYAANMVVSTNINTATNSELCQLTDITSAEARAIINFRNRQWFTDTYQLFTESIISREKYEGIRRFVSVYDSDTIAYNPALTVDINTVPEEILYAYGVSYGLTLEKAQRIVNARANGYSFKSLGELCKITGVNLTDTQINQLAHRLIVSDAPNATYINLNTASADAMRSVGFLELEIAAIQAQQSWHMASGRDLPVDVSAYDPLVTLYTNINTATVTELQSLSPEFNTWFAAQIVNATVSQPFGTLYEVRVFFESYGYAELYTSVSAYLVLR